MTTLSHTSGSASHATLGSSPPRFYNIETDYPGASYGVNSGFITSIRPTLSMSSSPILVTSSPEQDFCASPTIIATAVTDRTALGVRVQAASVPIDDQPAQAENSLPLPPPLPPPQQQTQQDGSVSGAIIIGVIFAILAVCLIVASCCWIACIRGSIPFQLRSSK
ncbi:hypothetical protein PGQ11_015386 [Apiospora arundinis]|uniref:Uncharacterized protein n=1 Tax=Apiospora arundinis TaxID=335852 RepID=A0ABR2HL79_9PEZI